MANTDRIRLPRAERRTQIIRAASTAFLGRGFSGTSMDDVARAAGVTRLIVYRIFDSKYELYTAVLDGTVRQLAARFESPADPTQSVTARIMDVARADPDGFRLLWRHAIREPEFTEMAEVFRTILVERAEQLMAPFIDDRTLLAWAARSTVNYLFESVCLWLDLGASDRDGDAADALTSSVRAMVQSWYSPGASGGDNAPRPAVGTQ